MNERIIDFIRDQKIASICCVDEANLPYCFSCFFAFDAHRQQLIFKTSADTRHAQMLLKKPEVAGTIQPDRLNPLAIRGLQFTGRLLSPMEGHESAAGIYHRKYPFALAMKGEIWVIQLNYIKMTDNTLSFGKKIIWEPDAATVA